MIHRNEPCWCGRKKKWKSCHYPVTLQSDFATLALKYKKQFGIILKTDEQIRGIRRACQLAASILQKTCSFAQIGVTTNELNDFAHCLHLEAHAIPAALHYGEPPFPKSICTSLNEVICHGIPNDVPLKEGDILNIDVALILQNYYGDCSAMVTMGEIDADKKKVVDVAYASLMGAIDLLKPGLFIYEIGDFIENYAQRYQCSVVNQFVAHGVGLEFHEPPQIPHHYNQNHTPLAAGMTFTIEPMINAGVHSGVLDSQDGWTTRTADGRASAQWEHTLLITPQGHEILTQI